jgi:putative proteasome-type protease
MTFCIGIAVRDGLVALADTQIVRGSERSSKSKLAVLQHRDDSFFVMTSGLRSVRDKTMTYLEEALVASTEPADRLYKVATLFGQKLREVHGEDSASLAQSGFQFNLNAIIGGCLDADAEPRLYYVYPEGNWIESAPDAPCFVIGRTHYAKPILDRFLRFTTSLPRATALAMLAFDATRTSVTDVDFPVDVAVVAKETRRASFQRFEEAPLRDPLEWWHARLATALEEMPMRWADALLGPQRVEKVGDAA